MRSPNVCLFFIALFVFNGSSLKGQETFSLIKDIDENALNNYPYGLEIFQGNSIITSSSHGCSNGEGAFQLCSVISKWNFMGQLEGFTVVPGVTPALSDNIIVSDSNILFLGMDIFSGDYGKSTIISEVSADLEINSSRIITTDSSKVTSQIGIHCADDDIYVYGDLRDQSVETQESQVLKVKKNTNDTIKKFTFTSGAHGVSIISFDSNPSGDLVFLLYRFGGNSGTTGQRQSAKIIKIDPFGNRLDSLEYIDSRIENSKLLVGDDNFYYTSSYRTPFNLLSLAATRINKFDPTTGALVWSLELPNNQIENSRNFVVEDIEQSVTGNIMVCGRVFDATDSATGSPDVNSTWNGFVTMVSQEGELLWLRVFKNENKFLPIDIYGRFINSTIKNIVERENGQIVTLGLTYPTGFQSVSSNDLEVETRNLWLMTINNDGCLNNQPCEEIIRFEDTVITPLPTIGTTWTYSSIGLDFPGPHVGFFNSTITDTLTTNGQLKYLRTQSAFGLDTFYVAGSKMYFYDTQLQRYVMHFDFNNITGYEVDYEDSRGPQTATVRIDSVTTETISGRSLRVQHVDIFNSGSFEPYRTKIYEGIGNAAYDVSLFLGQGLFDYNPYPDELRCYESDSLSLKFVAYPCDSTWLVTSTAEVPLRNIKLYPNPANGEVRIDGLASETDFEVYSVAGRLLQNGTTTDGFIPLNYSGVLLIKFRANGNWVVRRVVNLE